MESRRCPGGAGMESGDAQEEDIASSAAPTSPGHLAWEGAGTADLSHLGHAGNVLSKSDNPLLLRSPVA